MAGISDLQDDSESSVVVEVLNNADLNDHDTIKNLVVPKFAIIADKIIDAAANLPSAEERSAAVSLMKPLERILHSNLSTVAKHSLSTLKFSKYSDIIKRILQSKDPSWVEIWAFAMNLAISCPKMALSVVNQFLKHTEYAFLHLAKSDDINVASQPYKAWSHAIDIFASNRETLSPTRLIKLLMQPLKMYQSKIKIEVWLKMILTIGTLEEQHILQLVEPFIESMVTRKKPNQPVLIETCPDDCCQALVELMSFKDLRGSYAHLILSNFERVASSQCSLNALIVLCDTFEGFLFESKQLKFVIEYVNTLCKICEVPEKQQLMNTFLRKLDIAHFDVTDFVSALKAKENWRDTNSRGVQFLMNDSIGSKRWLFFCRAYSMWLLDSGNEENSDFNLLSNCLNVAQDQVQGLTKEKQENINIIIEEIEKLCTKKGETRLKLKVKKQNAVTLEEDNKSKNGRPAIKSTFQYRKSKDEEKNRLVSEVNGIHGFLTDDSKSLKGSLTSSPLSLGNGPLRENKEKIVEPDSLVAAAPPVETVVVGSACVDEKENSGVLASAMPKKVPSTPPVDKKGKTVKKLTPSKCSYFEEDANDLVFIPPKTKTTPLTAHQIEKFSKSCSDIPALYQDLSQDTQTTNSNSQQVIVAAPGLQLGVTTDQPIIESTTPTRDVSVEPSSANGDTPTSSVNDDSKVKRSSLSSAKKLNFGLKESLEMVEPACEKNEADEQQEERTVKDSSDSNEVHNGDSCDTPAKRTRRASTKLKQFMEYQQKNVTKRTQSPRQSTPSKEDEPVLPTRKRRHALLPALSIKENESLNMPVDVEDSDVSEHSEESVRPSSRRGKSPDSDSVGDEDGGPPAKRKSIGRGRGRTSKNHASPSSLEAWLKKPSPVLVHESKEISNPPAPLVSSDSPITNDSAKVAVNPENAVPELVVEETKENGSLSDSTINMVLESSDDTDIALVICSPKRRILGTIREETPCRELIPKESTIEEEMDDDTKNENGPKNESTDRREENSPDFDETSQSNGHVSRRPRRSNTTKLLPVASRSSKIMKLAVAKRLKGATADGDAVDEDDNCPTPGKRRRNSIIPERLPEVWPSGPSTEWSPCVPAPLDYASPSRGLLKKPVDSATPSPATRKQVCFSNPLVSRGLLYVTNRLNGTGSLVQNESMGEKQEKEQKSEEIPPEDSRPVVPENRDHIEENLEEEMDTSKPAEDLSNIVDVPESPPVEPAANAKAGEDRVFFDTWSQTDHVKQVQVETQANNTCELDAIESLCKRIEAAADRMELNARRQGEIMRQEASKLRKLLLMQKPII